MTQDNLPREEPTQEEIDGVARVFKQVENDEIARQSAYIMAKMLKRVFVASASHTRQDLLTREEIEKIVREIHQDGFSGGLHGNCAFPKGQLDRFVDRIVDTLADSKTSQGWQPIETAPRDGTRIWAFFPFNGGSAYAVHWGLNHYEVGENWTLDDGGSASLTYDPPSNWQPLPSPPTLSAKDNNNEQ